MLKRGLQVVGFLFCLDLIGNNNGQTCPDFTVNITGINFTDLVSYYIVDLHIYGFWLNCNSVKQGNLGHILNTLKFGLILPQYVVNN
jgi:hypothetical protein